MSEPLVTCPVCLIPNFTPRGLKAHKCRGGTRLNRETGLVEVIAPAKPESHLTRRAREIREARPTQLPSASPVESPTHKGPGKPCKLTLPVAVHSPCLDVSEVPIDGPSSSSLASCSLVSCVSPVAEINAFHRRATASAEQARQSAADACHYAVLCGVRLKALKDTTPHGDWGKLFANSAQRLTPNVTQIGECVTFEFSHQTASRYMEVSKRIQSAKRLSGTAVRRLASIAEAAEVDEASRKWLNKLTEGQNLRQLYLDLEIIGSKDKAPPAAPAPARVVKSEAQLRMEDAREAFFVWRETWARWVKRGHLDDLPQPELRELHEFLATCRDATKARLAPAKSKP